MTQRLASRRVLLPKKLIIRGRGPGSMRRLLRLRARSASREERITDGQRPKKSVRDHRLFCAGVSGCLPVLWLARFIWRQRAEREAPGVCGGESDAES